MKILFIFLTLVQTSLVFASGHDDKAVDQVRLSLWYQGVDHKIESINNDGKTELKQAAMPEELEKAIEQSRL
jgi:hypothetical protein